MSNFIPQPPDIQSISFNRLSNNTVQIVCNGFTTDIANPQNIVCRQLTNSDNRIVVKTIGDKKKYVFALSALTTINGVAWTGTIVQYAIDAITAGVFGGDGDTITKKNQTITFVAPASVVHTAPPFALGGSSDSGLALSYASSDNTKFTIAGNVLTPVAAGTANITVTQAGNLFYNAATPVVVPYTLT